MNAETRTYTVPVEGANWQAKCDCGWAAEARYNPWRAEQDAIHHLKSAHGVEAKR